MAGRFHFLLVLHVLTHSTTSGYQVDRPTSTIPAAGSAYGMLPSGEYRLVQAGAVWSFEAADFLSVSSPVANATPERTRCAIADQVAYPNAFQLELRLQRRALDHRLQRLGIVLPRNPRICGRAAELLDAHATALTAFEPFVDPANADGLEKETVLIVADGLRVATMHCQADWQPLRRYWFQRIWWHIERNLFEPNMSPARLSEDLGISRSALYRHFNPTGGIMHYVWHRRSENIIVRQHVSD